MIQELDLVALAENLPEYGLEAGDIGTVVLVQQAGRGFEVDFATLSGETLAVFTEADTASVRSANARLRTCARSRGQLALASVAGMDNGPMLEPCPPLRGKLEDRRAEILRLCALYGARNPRIFGSVARGEAGEQSDIDFLV